MYMKKLVKDYKLVLSLVTFIGINIYNYILGAGVNLETFIFSLVASAAMYLIAYFLNF